MLSYSVQVLAKYAAQERMTDVRILAIQYTMTSEPMYQKNIHTSPLPAFI
jgi:hypothetical protein